MSRGMAGSDELMPGSQPTYTMQTSGPITPPINRDNLVAFCLGQHPHPMRAEEVICRHCGSLAAGTQLGVYQVQRQLGRGRGGSAYLATHMRSQQPVTLKLIVADPASIGLWETVRKEVRIVTSLRHPAILPVFSCTTWHPDTHPGNSRPFHELMTAYPTQELYLLTLRQYVPVTLSQYAAQYERSEMHLTLRRRGVEPLAHLLSLVQQVGAALSAAHTRGLVHGGLLPGNILVDSREHIWLADFGLTRLHPPSAPYLAPELHIVSSACMQAGNLAPYWNAVTPASDQYMLAVLCQQLFSRLLHPAEYEHLQPVLHYATHSRPSQRFASVEQLMYELVAQANRSQQSSPLLSRTQQRSGSGERWEQSRSVPVGHSGQVVSPTPALSDRSQQVANYSLASAVPSSPADDWEKLGGKLFTEHDYGSAVKAYLRALELDTKKATLWLALGDAYFAQENYADALGAYEQAIQRNPNDPLAWSNRGTALDALGRHKEAEECYERADQLNA